MTPDDAHTSHNHGFELPEAPHVVVRNDPRRWRALAGVAVCLGLAGVVTGIIVAHRQSVSDEHLTSDALQREELRDGWKALGAAAVQDARADDAQPAAAANTAAPPQNVVVVNVPSSSAPTAPPSVTNINLPSGAYGANANSGYLPTQSMPANNYTPVAGYVPAPIDYGAAPAGSVTPNGYAPQNSYATSTGSVAPLTPAVGNGSIPGSTPNPALPNNGLVGSTPTPGLPNGSMNGSPTPNVPVGSAPASPGAPSLPSGFGAP